MRFLRLGPALTLLLGVAAGAFFFYAWQNQRGTLKNDLDASHHAVLLNNNQAYFGRLELKDGDYLVLNDVFYVQSRVDEETKKTSHALVKRGNEMHGPTKMILNRSNVQFIEPVSPTSQVGKLIADAARGSSK